MRALNLAQQEVIRQESGGMRAAEWYIERRDAIRGRPLSAGEVRRIGDLLWQYWTRRGRADFANGWQEMCYIISRRRGQDV